MKLDVDRELMERVWKRVSGSGESCAGGSKHSAAALLESFIDGEANAAGLWQELYRRSGNDRRRLFSRLYNDDIGHLRKLQAVYFMKTGKNHRPAQSARQTHSPLELVRIGYAAAQNAQKAYLAAAETDDAPCSREFLLTLARDEDAHARRLEAFIEKML